MALANSSLAMAAESISVALQAALTDITVIVGTPMAAKTMADTSSEKHYLNIFFYRVAPSGFHAAQSTNDPLFLRVSALLTPFTAKTISNPEPHAALRVLGETMRYFHENPISEALPSGGTTANHRTEYMLEAALQAPTMEELNHIWTTQGSDVGYQMSAAYEFSLIPIDPQTQASPVGRVHTAQVQVGLDPSDPAGPQDYDIEFTNIPASNADSTWNGTPHLPQLLALGADGPVGNLEVPQSTTEIAFALSGAPNTRAQVELTTRDAAGQDIVVVTQAFDVVVPLPDQPQARIAIPVDLTGAESVVAQVREADVNGTALQPDRIGNTLTLAVTGGP